MDLRKNHVPTAYKFLALAILSEVIATRLLKRSDGLTKLWPAGFLALAFINISYSCLAQTLKADVLPLGVAYGIWSAVGIVLIATIDVILGQRLDIPAIAGLALIVVGVVIITFLSDFFSRG